MTRLAIVIPCYNEEEVFNDTLAQLDAYLLDLIKSDTISKDSFLLFVNDGSKDRTWNLITAACKHNTRCKGIKLASNVGHQKALLAGLHYVKDLCDASISIDADLQDDIHVINDMILKYKEGCEIVYGVRSERRTDSFFKRFSAQGFYKLMQFMGVNVVYNHADFRLMGKRALQQLAKYDERNLFLRGLISTIGYKTDCVYYARKERMAGESKYPLKKMLSLAFDGITSFSIKPITIVMFLGLSIILCSCLAFVYIIFSYFFGWTMPGWSSIMISIWFLGGIQLFAIGLIGEYIGKIYVETKRRPRYNIEKLVGEDHETTI